MMILHYMDFYGIVVMEHYIKRKQWKINCGAVDGATINLSYGYKTYSKGRFLNKHLCARDNKNV